MATQKIKIMLVGHSIPGALESSYCRAFETLECEVISFDIESAIDSYAFMGLPGRLLNAFVPIEPWIRKANRQMVQIAMQQQCHILITVGAHPIQVGALAQIRASTDALLVHIWPDTLVNWSSSFTSNLPLYDLVATYSAKTAPIFQQLGAKNVIWLPLAGDPFLPSTGKYPPLDNNTYYHDVTFVGGWRPEREKILSQLGDFNLKIWGPDWGRRCRGNSVIMHAWQRRAVYGQEFAQVTSHSKINLNIIDPTNYPAANMRFFEIAVAGGLQISSACPEMENEFRDGEHIFYYHHPDQLPKLLRSLLAQHDVCLKVAQAGQAQVMAHHTYVHRAQQILDLCLSEFSKSSLQSVTQTAEG